MIAGGRDSSGMMRVSGQARARRPDRDMGRSGKRGHARRRGPWEAALAAALKVEVLLAPNSPAGSWAL